MFKQSYSIGVVFFLVILITGCTNMFFFPMKNHVLSPGKIGLLYEDIYIPTDDGTKLHAWFLPSFDDAKATILFLHGNAENISTHIGAVHWLPRYGFNVLLYDYRGYGKSGGELGVETAINDFNHVLNYLTKRDDVKNGKVIVYGQSLGGAIAANAVAKNSSNNHIAGLVIESSFSDFREIAREKLNESWLTWAFQWPLALTVTADYSSKKALANIHNIPILIIHGTDDRIIPFHHGEALYQAALNPKEFWAIPGGTHTSASRSKSFRKRLAKYFEELP